MYFTSGVFAAKCVFLVDQVVEGAAGGGVIWSGAPVKGRSHIETQLNS